MTQLSAPNATRPFLILFVLLLAAVASSPGAVGVLGAFSSGHAATPIDRTLSVGPVSTWAPHPWTCHGLRMIMTVACGGLAAPHAVPSPFASTPGWTAVRPSPPPQSGVGFTMTWDPSDGYVVLLGALPVGSSNILQSDMWSYSNGNWTELHPAILPQFCWGSVVAYDSIDGYLLYFGGPDPGYGSPTCSSANQTWSYHAGVWSQLHPTTSPAPLSWESLTNDSADGYMLLFGGERSSGCAPAGYCGATWKFVGGNWTQLSPVGSPSARAESGLAYDVADGYVLLFGGVNQSGPLNDTWKFSGGNWTRLHPTLTPPTPTPDALSYDTSDQSVVYNTARNWSGSVPEIAWTYHAGNWSAITSTAPNQRLGMMSADDPKDGFELLFGGTSPGLTDTWSIHGGVWTNRTPLAPSPRYYAAAAYDGSSSKYTLFGGVTYVGCCATDDSDTWTFSGSAWTPLSTTTAPPARNSASLVYDAHDGYLLLYGGDGASGGLNDTWEFAGGNWTQVTPIVSPPRGGGFWSEAVYDGADGYVLLAVGVLGHIWTWTYSGGVWTNRTSTAGTAPPGPSANPLVYDSTDGTVVWFGTVTPAITNDTWTFHGGKWTNLTKSVVGAPPPTSSAALADFPAGGYVLLQEANSQGNTWTYANGTWTQLFVANGPVPRFGAAMAYAPSGQVDVLFGGSGSGCATPYGNCADTWLWSNSGPVSPYIRSFTASPSTTDVGTASKLAVSAFGGVAPLKYAYTGLPAGCASANQSALACDPSSSGTYQVQVAVTDSAGHVVTASTSLVVNLALGSASLAASPNPITLGGTVVLTTTSSGGTAPYSYLYSGLPTGCTSQTVPSLPCSPNASGNWTAKVVVTDAVGQSVSATAAVTVGAAGASGKPAISAFGAYPAAIVLGNTTNFTVSAAGGTKPLSYAYSNLPAGCSSGNQTKLACTPISAGVFSVLVNVTDAAGGWSSVTTNLTVYPVGGGAGLTVSGFGASPGKFDLGSSTVLAVIASGGVGPIGYSYAGLPPGCTAANSSLLPCAPTSPGTYTVYATVFDSATDHAGVRTVLEVLPTTVGAGPLVSRFLLSPTNLTVGTTVTIVATVSGGTLPLTFTYTGLPTGCASQNASVFACIPEMTGNFTVSVQVSDALGRTAVAHALLNVAPAPVSRTSSGGGGSVSFLESPAVLVGSFLSGLLLTLALAVIVERRRHRRREARELVDALSSTTDLSPPDDLGA